MDGADHDCHPDTHWVINMVDSELERLKDPYQGLNSIFKAPQTLLHLYPTHFTPQVISFGPYHRGKFPQTDKHKARFLRRVLHRTGRSLRQLVDLMLRIQDTARRGYVYEPGTDLNSPEFVTMLLLDGCFILELFNVSHYNLHECGYQVDDPIFNCRGIYPFIQRDLLMLENQIPLCVLDRLFPYTWPESKSPPENLCVTSLALNFFNSNSIIPGQPNNVISSTREPLHLLDMVGLSLMRARARTQHRNSKADDWQEIVMHNVTKLAVVGVNFVRKSDPRDFMDIEFDAKRGVLKIPRLHIQEFTKHIFLNLMAFEHYYPHSNNHLTSYIIFMAGLIHTTKDVEQLREKGIVECWSGGDDDVVHLFNNLRKEVVFNTKDYYLSSVTIDLHRRFTSKWHNLKADLKREYFEMSALVVGIFLFFATLAQTVFAGLAYYFPTTN